MRHDLVLKADTAAERFILGFLNTCSGHPVLTIEFLAAVLALVVMLWVELFKASGSSS